MSEINILKYFIIQINIKIELLSYKNEYFEYYNTPESVNTTIYLVNNLSFYDYFY